MSKPACSDTALVRILETMHISTVAVIIFRKKNKQPAQNDNDNSLKTNVPVDTSSPTGNDRSRGSQHNI